MAPVRKSDHPILSKEQTQPNSTHPSSDQKPLHQNKTQNNPLRVKPVCLLGAPTRERRTWATNLVKTENSLLRNEFVVSPIIFVFSVEVLDTLPKSVRNPLLPPQKQEAAQQKKHPTSPTALLLRT